MSLVPGLNGQPIDDDDDEPVVRRRRREADWRDHAACADDAENPDDWDMAASTPAERTHAVAVCAGCPVMAQCLELARVEPPYGLIMGGLGWRAPSLEPVDPIGLHLLRPRRKAPSRAIPHGYGAYGRGCRCDVCKAAKRAYTASRRSIVSAQLKALAA